MSDFDEFDEFDDGFGSDEFNMDEDGIIVDYSDDGDDQNAMIENAYYNSKGCIAESPLEALSGFRMVVEIDEARGEWGFKALKQIVKLNYRIGKYDDMIRSYEELLEFSKFASMHQNLVEKVINSILELVSAKNDPKRLRELYELSLGVLSKTQRLWFKANMELAKLLLEMKEFSQVSEIASTLHKEIENQGGGGTQLVELYVLEMQLYSEMKDTKNLREVHRKANTVKNVILHPRLQGIQREISGKLHMQEREWNQANEDFFEAFKSFDECGSGRRILCLKYVVLANMLVSSRINPFGSQETKPYEKHPELQSMRKLVSAYQEGSVGKFHDALEQAREDLEDDFMREFVHDLLKNMRTNVLIKLIMPYESVKLEYLAAEIQISTNLVEEILVEMILDGKVDGLIDQISGIYAKKKIPKNDKLYKSLETHALKLGVFQQEICEFANF